MAIRVPTYRERQVQQQAVPNVRQQIDTPAAAFGSLQADALVNSGTAAVRLGEQWNRKAINMQEETNELYALQLQTEAEREASDFVYNPETGLLAQKGRNGLDAPKLMAAKIGEIQKRFDNTKDIPQEVRSMLQRGMIQIGRRYGDLANRHALGEYTTYKEQTLQARMELNMQDIAMNYMDDAEFQKKANENFQLLQSRATSEGWDDAKLESEKLRLYSAQRSTQISSMIASDEPQNILVAQKVYQEARNRNQIGFEDSLKIEGLLDKAVPKAAAMVAWQRGRLGASVTDESGIMSFVIDNLEGGDAIAQEPDGAIAKFGINSKWNPDVDVANLTREGAEKIYKEKYWNAYGIDEVPENMRLLAFDIAVNHRSDFAKKMIGEIKNGAMPDKILNQRLKEYQRLATTEPDKYGKYYNGWKDRLNRISTQISDTMPVDSAAVYSAASQLDRQYPGSGAELIALYDNESKAKEAQRTARKNEVQDTVNQIVSQNNGDWTKVPANVRAEAAQHGIDVTAFKGVSDPEVKAELEAMTSNEFFSVDLNDARYAHNLTYADRQDYAKKQAELQKPENKYTADLVDGVVSYYFRTANKGRAGDPTSTYNKAAVAQMKNYVMFKTNELIAAKKTPTKADINRFASEYLGQIKTAGIKSAADIDPAERAVIESDLLRIGMIPTNESVMAVYMNTRGQKK